MRFSRTSKEEPKTATAEGRDTVERHGRPNADRKKSGQREKGSEETRGFLRCALRCTRPELASSPRRHATPRHAARRRPPLIAGLPGAAGLVTGGMNADRDLVINAFGVDVPAALDGEWR